MCDECEECDQHKQPELGIVKADKGANHIYNDDIFARLAQGHPINSIIELPPWPRDPQPSAE